jgi:hypothetical protein
MATDGGGQDSSRRAGLLLGAGFAVAGLLPWLAQAQPLPLQNLWRVTVLPSQMPWAARPLNQYFLDVLVALLAAAGPGAGLLLRRLRGPGLRGPTGTGMVAVQLAAGVQAFVVLVPGLRPSSLAAVYVAVLVLTCAIGIGLGQFTRRCVATGPRWLASIGVGLAAVPAGTWLLAWVTLGQNPFGAPAALTGALQWVPALVVGAALVWCGLTRRAEVVAWLINLAALWLVPAIVAGARSAVARNTVREGVGAIIRTLRAVVPDTLLSWGPTTQAVVVAAVIGLIGTVLRRFIDLRRASSGGAEAAKTLR